MKVVVPTKEYPAFIECDVYDKNFLGESRFLYRDTIPKKPIDIETFKKLQRYEKTLEFLENKLEFLTFIHADGEIIKLVENTIDKLTRDEVI